MAYLTDVAGERSVVVEASPIVGGTPVSHALAINFGPGPLSIFSGVRYSRMAFTSKGDLGAFPVAVLDPAEAPLLCDSSWNDNLSFGGAPVAGVELAYSPPWIQSYEGAASFGRSPGSRLPTKDELVAVYSSIPSK